ncbi:hypothetical protein ACCO45_009525 [Purpureocillium lilacinum]|uniref:Uncharacterized protein n=1 Tax=Purpureocillium lilacinum TaxID=33203 RepID=A0ACC4DLF2_PURLI
MRNPPPLPLRTASSNHCPRCLLDGDATSCETQLRAYAEAHAELRERGRPVRDLYRIARRGDLPVRVHPVLAKAALALLRDPPSYTGGMPRSFLSTSSSSGEE